MNAKLLIHRTLACKRVPTTAKKKKQANNVGYGSCLQSRVCKIASLRGRIFILSPRRRLKSMSFH